MCSLDHCSSLRSLEHIVTTDHISSELLCFPCSSRDGNWEGSVNQSPPAVTSLDRLYRSRALHSTIPMSDSICISETLGYSPSREMALGSRAMLSRRYKPQCSSTRFTFHPPGLIRQAQYVYHFPGIPRPQDFAIFYRYATFYHPVPQRERTSLICMLLHTPDLHFLVSGATIFFWDYLLVFPRELSYIWSDAWTLRKISKVKLAYIVSRYGFPLAFMLFVIGMNVIRSLITLFLDALFYAHFDYRPNVPYTVEQYLGK